MRHTGPGWAHFFAAIFTAAFFLLLTVKAVIPAMVCGLLAIAMVMRWLWQTDPPPTKPVGIGGGIILPTYMVGPASHSWGAMVVLILVASALYFSFVFAYFYLWTVSPKVWPEISALPALAWPILAAFALAGSAAALAYARRLLARRGTSRPAFLILVIFGLAALGAALILDTASQLSVGLTPSESAYGAATYTAAFLQFQIAVPVILMGLFLLARVLSNQVDAERRVTFDNMALLWKYAIAQGALGLLLTHGYPRLVG
jgi:cytochrome c oxidase subunit I+III